MLAIPQRCLDLWTAGWRYASTRGNEQLRWADTGRSGRGLARCS